MKAKLALKKIAAIAMVAAMSTCVLTACGGSSEEVAVEDTADEAADEAPAEEEEVAEEETEAAEAAEAAEATEDEDAAAGEAFLTEYCDSYFMGKTENEEYILYATTEAENGGYGYILFYDPEQNQYVSFFGQEVVNGANISISDETNGMTISFDSVAGETEGTVDIDLGDSGKGVLVPATLDEFMECLAGLDTAESVG